MVFLYYISLNEDIQTYSILLLVFMSGVETSTFSRKLESMLSVTKLVISFHNDSAWGRCQNKCNRVWPDKTRASFWRNFLLSWWEKNIFIANFMWISILSYCDWKDYSNRQQQWDVQHFLRATHWSSIRLLLLYSLQITITDNYRFVVAVTNTITDDINLTNAKMWRVQ